MKFTDQGQGENDFNAQDDQGRATLAPDRVTTEVDTFGFVRSSIDDPSFGCHLRAAREERQLSLQECAHALRLPVRLLQKLEQDNYEGIDYSVYLRGYLSKYAAHIGLDRQILEEQLERLQPRQPELVVTQRLSTWQRVIHRYSSAATYVVLTAVIVVPLIWLGLHGVLKRDIAKLAPLDATPVSAQSTELADMGAATPENGKQGASPQLTAGQPPASSAKDAGKSMEKPLMASMAPFSAMESPKVDAPAVTAEAQPVDDAATRMTLKLQKASWVEITDTTGKRLEYGLLPAGTRKSYESSSPLDVRIGNAEGAKVDIDGKPLALDRFRRANVAHFNVANNGQAQPYNG